MFGSAHRRPRQRDHTATGWWRRTPVIVGVATAVVVGYLGVRVGTSYAAFTESEQVTANTFSTGTIDLTTAPTSAVAPGDQVTAPLTVTNNGTLDLRYAVSSVTTEDVLAAQLDLTVKVGVTTCTDAGFGVDGTVLYGPGDLGLIAGVAIFGDPAQGAQAGDRTLTASANEVLCVNVLLPLSTGNASQGLSSTATFTFDAEQIANNP